MDITVENLDHWYGKGTPFEKKALTNISLHIASKSYTAIIGHTGSGKSTLVQHMNGLLKPTAGTIKVGTHVIEGGKKSKDMKDLRRSVGFVFQYPEHQLFDETVEKDIAFGPVNFGMSEELAKKKAREVLHKVGLPADVLHRSPFELSGGQKRRAAIAGVLAMTPSVLILDEPTAGLDPKGRRDIMNLFYQLHQEEGLTTVLVTHNMLDAALFADHIYVMDAGEIAMQGTPAEIFASTKELQKIGLDVPESVQMIEMVEKQFQVQMKRDVFTSLAVAEEIDKHICYKE
ncbi:energy-coupling factor ABC transporter ATP-binding protein [Bacillus alkalicellulosilyticus]|uniref:energy-coupling factor ABC transporter ATP-binding protein n=1 Tax=Alkalihalobacterium alkalicellulosilyticum TaxID=1912214 RepID=UPI0009970357|nr:energy-coupling factor ABC transporter ATP-binding protein [Bacillus alkalicellulosilyticus]